MKVKVQRCANHIFVIILGLFLAYACGTFSSGSMDGRILDIRGRAVPGALVLVNDKEYRTDAGGYFRAGSLASGMYVIKVRAKGFAEAFKRVSVRKDKNTAFDLRLLRGTQVKIADFRKANRIRVSKLELQVPANSLVDADGNSPRSGKLEFAVLDPRGDGARAMPGGFRGVTADGKTVNLESMGAASLVLRSGNGKELQVKKGRELVMYLPLQGRVAPGVKSIPMWYLDEKSGLWKNQGRGIITRRGGRRVVRAKLPHLSWWNVDAPYHDKSSIWIKSIVGSDGYFLKNPTILARGLDYNGMSSGTAGRDGVGYCVDAKLGSRVSLESFYRDEDRLYERKREIRLKGTPSSCDTNPQDGVIIEKLVMPSTEFACVRGKVAVDENTASGLANGELRVELTTGGRYPVVIESRTVSEDGEFILKKLPGNIRGKIHLRHGKGSRQVKDQMMIFKSSSRDFGTQADGGSSCRDLGEFKAEFQPYDCDKHVIGTGHGPGFSRSYDVFTLRGGGKLRGCGRNFFREKLYGICFVDGSFRIMDRSRIVHTRMYARNKSGKRMYTRGNNGEK